MTHEPWRSTVSTPSLTPRQVPTRRGMRIASDFRVVQLIKHPYPSEFHSKAEYYHAALLEGEPGVSHFVPQPFRLRVGNKVYCPDCYLVRDGQAIVVELKPRKQAHSVHAEALRAFFAHHRMTFDVVDNESLLARKIEAENWLQIVHTLVRHQELNTGRLEIQLYQRVLEVGQTSLGDWVDRGDREASRSTEIALLRLLHQGRLRADLTRERLGYTTVMQP